MKKILIAIGIILILASIPITVFLVKQQQEIRMRAAPATTLSFSPSDVTKEINQTFTLEVKINTGENQISAAELYITFDPNKLEGQQISAGTFLPVILVPGSVNQTSGIASITLGSSPTEPKQGTGTVAIVSFKTLTVTGTTQVAFGTNTQVAGVGEAGNVLIGTTPSTVTITSGATPTPTPTTGPTQTPTPTPGGGTPTPTSPPGTTLTPTPTSGIGGLEPTATPKPTPTTAVGTTPTPTVSPEQLPETGVIAPTLVFLVLGIFVLTSGLLLLF